MKENNKCNCCSDEAKFITTDGTAQFSMFGNNNYYFYTCPEFSDPNVQAWYEALLGQGLTKEQALKAMVDNLLARPTGYGWTYTT